MTPGALDRLYAEHVTHLEGRYAKALEAQPHDAIVIHSGALVKRSAFDDQYWPLRPVPHWQHWSSLAEPDCALVVRSGRRPMLLRPISRSFWEAPPPPESDTFERVFDVVTIADAAEIRRAIGGGRVAFVGESAAVAESWGIEGASVCPPALMSALNELRTTKTPYEVACIAEANLRARAGHDALRDLFREEDASELDLHLHYLRATSQDDWETPYKNIVAQGPSAATLHHVAYGRRATAREAESLLVDAGATCRGYCADVTRTWVKGNGAAAAKFGALVAGVEAMQRRLCAAIRVGLPYEQLHDESHRQLGSVLRDVGIVRTSADEAVDGGVTRAFYPHGLGHSLGLQTHDVGCGLRQPRAENPFLRNTSLIERGQVFTIEPGVYFIAALLEPLRRGPASRGIDWATVDALSPLGGVRIEDDVHVTGDAAMIRNLTREHLPVGGGKA